MIGQPFKSRKKSLHFTGKGYEFFHMDPSLWGHQGHLMKQDPIRSSLKTFQFKKEQP